MLTWLRPSPGLRVLDQTRCGSPRVRLVRSWCASPRHSRARHGRLGCPHHSTQPDGPGSHTTSRSNSCMASSNKRLSVGSRQLSIALASQASRDRRTPYINSLPSSVMMTSTRLRSCTSTTLSTRPSRSSPATVVAIDCGVTRSQAASPPAVSGPSFSRRFRTAKYESGTPPDGASRRNRRLSLLSTNSRSDATSAVSRLDVLTRPMLRGAPRSGSNVPRSLGDVVTPHVMSATAITLITSARHCTLTACGSDRP